MRLAEVFLRIGSAFVAWMMLFTHFVWLAVLFVVECGPDGDEMYRLLLGLAPFTCGFAFLVAATRKLAEIHVMLRWLGVPLLLLAPFCLRTIWSVYTAVNLGEQAICQTGQPPAWQFYWAPAQLLTIIVVLLLAVLAWRGARERGESAATN